MNSWIVISLLIINLHCPVDSPRIDTTTLAQDSSFKKTPELPEKYLSEVKQKSMRVEQQVNKRADKALSRLLKQEKKMKARLWKVDSVAAGNIFSKSIDSLGSLKAGLKNKVAGKLPLGNSYLDTLGNSLKCYGAY
jgi:hypothetical protein